MPLNSTKGHRQSVFFKLDQNPSLSDLNCFNVLVIMAYLCICGRMGCKMYLKSFRSNTVHFIFKTDFSLMTNHVNQNIKDAKIEATVIRGIKEISDSFCCFSYCFHLRKETCQQKKV